MTNDIRGETHLFAAANSYSGFISKFEEAFYHGGISKLYILKGGPGSGKSTIMKKYAEEAVKKGHTPILYHCSSDARSLDGVAIKETGTAIVDGTLPHALDTVYPGVRDFYVDLSPAWDKDRLAESSKEIKSLTDKKKQCYGSAYNLLAASETLSEQLIGIASGFVELEKLTAFADRLAKKCLNTKLYGRGNIKKVLVNANSSEGSVRFFTLENAADTVYFIKDTCLAAVFLLEELKRLAEKSSSDAVMALSPTNLQKTVAIYLPATRSCISLYDEDASKRLADEGKTVKLINTARFINATAYRQTRQKFKFLQKCSNALFSSALEQLSLAGSYHGALEDIYVRSTDYSVIDRITKQIS